ncbi:cytochrome P450 93A2-like [Gossypium hirsutum]|uniref:Cytochrome P450 93A2-like n=1 Tax=Gossypium hirsutum TaxID=3635 RepID=A0ABM3AP79_GOSHI|nr:cytochrome P450 93A2-like [Gossypium hirsutum]
MAGVDTTAAAIRWAMKELINHPNIFKILREEIDSVVGNNRLIKESDVPKLPYLQAVAKEILRLHPPSPFLRRLSNKDSKINGFDIQKGTRVFINVYMLMRDPNCYKEPEKFMPERFLGNCTEMKGRDFHYLPFGSGRRGCPGASLATSLLHATIGALVQCFDWKVKDGEKADTVLKAGLQCNMEPEACYYRDQQLSSSAHFAWYARMVFRPNEATDIAVLF